MAPKDGKALMLLSLAAGNDPSQAADAMLQQYPVNPAELNAGMRQ